MAQCSPLVNKFAFFPDRRDTIPVHALPENVKEIFVTASDKTRLQCYLLPAPGADAVLIYFHGNGGNIGQRLPELGHFRDFGVAVLGVGYRGYGKSGGRPSEKGIYKDGAAAFRYAVDSLRFKPERVILCGRSIGTTVAITTAVGSTPGGLILVTPLTTGRAYGKANGMGIFSLLAGDAFDNLSKCPRLRCPVLVLHGTMDEVIPFAMGRQVYEGITTAKQFVAIPGGQHNDLEFKSPGYWNAIRDFIGSIAHS
jgi:uncharacterized protein